jgi:hypothetical protein
VSVSGLLFLKLRNHGSYCRLSERFAISVMAITAKAAIRPYSGRIESNAGEARR